MDYEAVAEALKHGHLFAAAADVFSVEPLPADSRLRQLPNFILTPHLAGGTRQAAEKAVRIATEGKWAGPLQPARGLLNQPATTK